MAPPAIRMGQLPRWQHVSLASSDAAAAENREKKQEKEPRRQPLFPVIEPPPMQWSRCRGRGVCLVIGEPRPPVIRQDPGRDRRRRPPAKVASPSAQCLAMCAPAQTPMRPPPPENRRSCPPAKGLRPMWPPPKPPPCGPSATHTMPTAARRPAACHLGPQISGKKACHASTGPFAKHHHFVPPLMNFSPFGDGRTLRHRSPSPVGVGAKQTTSVAKWR